MRWRNDWIWILGLGVALFSLRLFWLDEDVFVPGGEMIRLGLSLKSYLLISALSWGGIGVWFYLSFKTYDWRSVISNLLLLPVMLFGSITWPVLLVAVLLVMVLSLSRKNKKVGWAQKLWPKLALILAGLLSIWLVMKTTASPFESWRQLKPEVVGAEINLRSGQEFSQLGENILPLQLKRMVMNKLYLPFFYIQRSLVSLLDLEAWFFAYNMQQNLIWSEGWIEKQIFAGLDWLILFLAVWGIVRLKRKQTNWLWFSFILILGLGLILGKGNMNLLLLLALPLVYELLQLGIESLLELERLKKVVWAVAAFLMLISIGTRLNLLLNHQMLWLDNRVLASKFIADNLETIESLEADRVVVSSRFGPARDYVSFFAQRDLEAEGVEFSALPEETVAEWPRGVYTGLQGEFYLFERGQHKTEIVTELHLRDRLVNNMGQELLVVRKL